MSEKATDSSELPADGVVPSARVETIERLCQALVRFTVALALAIAGQACAADQERYQQLASPIVYGSDDRIEFFDVAASELRARMSASMVALVPRIWVSGQTGNVAIAAPTWGELDGLCPGERFADQPAAAFCTGVLVDWDLVLTAGHCVRLFALEDFAVVFGYYYAAPGALAVSDIRNPVAIVAEALDPDGSEPRLDYAWLRLGATVGPPRQPAPIYVRSPAVTVADSIVSIGTGGGIPLKLDQGAVIRDLREQPADYFIADTDTSKGASGGGAFDHRLALLGTLARGEMDFVDTPEGCATVIRQPDGVLAREQFTYAHRAVQALCQKDPTASSICRPDCNNPCRAAPPPSVLVAGGGCAVSAFRPLATFATRWTFAVVLAILCCRMRAKRAIVARRDGVRSAVLTTPGCRRKPSRASD